MQPKFETTPTRLRDSDIRSVLIKEINTCFPDRKQDLVIQEFGCNKARIDIAVINGALHGFEIKSDSDSLDRLPQQIKAYQGVFEYITLVCGRRLLDRARTTIPKWWGLQKAESKNGRVVLSPIRKPRMNPSQDSRALAGMLWKTEALACLRKHGHRKVVTAKHSADEVLQAVANNVPIAVLSDDVRQAIKIRGGSGFEWLRTQYDDSQTTASTVDRRRYRENFDWLLSLK